MFGPVEPKDNSARCLAVATLSRRFYSFLSSPTWTNDIQYAGCSNHERLCELQTKEERLRHEETDMWSMSASQDALCV